MARRVTAGILSALALLVFGWLALFQVRYFDAVPDAVEFHRPAGSAAFPADSLDSLRETVPATGCAAQRGSVWVRSGQSAEVLMLYTDPVYQTVYSLPMEAGGFWGASDGVVISDSLAKELFFSVDCVGAELCLSSGSFQISGVYRAEKGFLARAVPQPDVILPLPEGMEIDRIAFLGSEPENYYLTLVPQNTANQLSGWEAVRLRPEANLLLYFDQWVLLAMWAIAFCWLACRISKMVRRLGDGMGTSLQSRYWRGAILENRREASALLLTASTGLLCSAVILWAVTRPLTLPADIYSGSLFSLNGWMNELARRIARPLRLSNPALGEGLMRNIWAAAVTVADLLAGGVLSLAAALVDRPVK